MYVCVIQLNLFYTYSTKVKLSRRENKRERERDWERERGQNKMVKLVDFAALSFTHAKELFVWDRLIFQI